MRIADARTNWAKHRGEFAKRGVTLPLVSSYLPDEFRRDWEMAMDAQPVIFTEPNSAIPAIFTTFVDPQTFEVLFAPLDAAEVLGGEEREGDWTVDTALFPIVEHTGEVSSYDDYSENGRAGANANWPARQNYIFQTMKEFGDREVERAGAAKLNWVAQVDKAAARALNTFQNLTYLYGISGLATYGLLNEPNLPASYTAATKAAGGTAWVDANGVFKATANEVYADIQTLYWALVKQSGGNVKQTDKMTLALPPLSATALTVTNSFAVNVTDLLKKNFPNMRVVQVPQYGALSATNPQGAAAGNIAQLIADEVQGQQTGKPAFSEKMRAFPIVRGSSSWRQKVIGGTWGAVIRQPFSISSMVGI